MKKITKILKYAVIGGDHETRLKSVEEAVIKKQRELMDSEDDPIKEKEISDEIRALREEKQNILSEAANDRELQERIKDLTDFLEEQTVEITEYSEVLVRRLIEKVIVYDGKLTVEFKSGLTIDVDA